MSPSSYTYTAHPIRQRVSYVSDLKRSHFLHSSVNCLCYHLGCHFMKHHLFVFILWSFSCTLGDWCHSHILFIFPKHFFFLKYMHSWGSGKSHSLANNLALLPWLAHRRLCNFHRHRACAIARSGSHFWYWPDTTGLFLSNRRWLGVEELFNVFLRLHLSNLHLVFHMVFPVILLVLKLLVPLTHLHKYRAHFIPMKIRHMNTSKSWWTLGTRRRHTQYLVSTVLDLKGANAPPLWWLVMYFCVHSYLHESIKWLYSSGMQQQQPDTVTHLRISSLLISRRLSRTRVASRYSV